MRAAIVTALGVLAWPALAPALGLMVWVPSARAHEAGHAQPEERLPAIGAAPDFALISQDGKEVRLADLRGKVVAVAFIYTSCPDVCPMLTDKMARVQDELGADFGREVAFVSITVDPERDTPEVLKGYAEAFDADLAGWSFLTGAPPAVLDVAHRYGVAVAKAADGGVDHTLLTTLVDRNGTMRVQYLGYRFDPEEFRRDLQSLVDEP
jgi:protein SCO1/2